ARAEPGGGARAFDRTRDLDRAVAVRVRLDDRPQRHAGERGDRARVVDDRGKVDLDPRPPDHRARNHSGDLAPARPRLQGNAAECQTLRRAPQIDLDPPRSGFSPDGSNPLGDYAAFFFSARSINAGVTTSERPRGMMRPSRA